MKFSSKEDLEAPAAFVFEQLTDFEQFEREIRRRGATVTRKSDWVDPAVGNGWDIAFDWRGKRRQLGVTIDRLDPGQEMVFSGLSSGFELTLRMSFVELSPRRSRLGAEFEVRPRNLPSRLLLQSAKLGKAKLTRKFVTRMRMLAEELELRRREQVLAAKG